MQPERGRLGLNPGAPSPPLSVCAGAETGKAWGLRTCLRLLSARVLGAGRGRVDSQQLPAGVRMRLEHAGSRAGLAVCCKGPCRSAAATMELREVKAQQTPPAPLCPSGSALQEPPGTSAQASGPGVWLLSGRRYPSPPPPLGSWLPSEDMHDTKSCFCHVLVCDAGPATPSVGPVYGLHGGFMVTCLSAPAWGGQSHSVVYCMLGT